MDNISILGTAYVCLMSLLASAVALCWMAMKSKVNPETIPTRRERHASR